MEAVLIEPRRKSDVRFLLNFSKQNGFKARTINSFEDFEDECLVSLIEEGLKTPRVSRSEVMEVLRRR